MFECEKHSFYRNKEKMKITRKIRINKYTKIATIDNNLSDNNNFISCLFEKYVISFF
jgi:hypothetical protein